MKSVYLIIVLLASLAVTDKVQGQVLYDNRLQVLGVQFLQDFKDPSIYHYIPQFPRLATKDDGTYEFLCIKYVGNDSEQNGGLFHALIEFTLPEEALAELETELRKKAPGARIAGPVPLMNAIDEGQEGVGSFEIVSSVLGSSEDEGGFTRSIVYSGNSSIMPGSKAVVAANLNQEGATLLWDSMQGPTSDVSVTIHGYYEAIVEGYNAVVTADVSTIYTHFSELSNKQQGFKKEQIRDIIDRLEKNQNLTIEVVDRTKVLGINTNLDRILDTVTEKLTDLMFDAETGWAQEPEREVAVEAGQIQGRQKRGWMARVFAGTKNLKYYSDNQYVLKNRQDIRSQTFRLNLSQKSSIRVPVHTSGNLGGIYDALGQDSLYFRIVDLNDPAFQFRNVHFQIDGNFIDSFEDLINFASVSFRKKYEDRPDHTPELYFNHVNVKEGETIQHVTYPRLGVDGAEWLDYEYRISWNMKGTGNLTIDLPNEPSEWLTSSDPVLALAPPFEKRIVEIEADPSLSKDSTWSLVTVQFATVLGGVNRKMRSVKIRASDPEMTAAIALYHDPGHEDHVVYKTTWYGNQGMYTERCVLDADFLYLQPPASLVSQDNCIVEEGHEQ